MESFEDWEAHGRNVCAESSMRVALEEFLSIGGAWRGWGWGLLVSHDVGTPVERSLADLSWI